MRTSRVSRDTARVVQALSSSTRGAAPGKRSSRGAGGDIRKERGNGNESEHVPAPLHPTNTQNATENTLGKRKRGNAVAPHRGTTLAVNETTMRRSPRKMPKTDSDSTEIGQPTGRKAKRQPAKRITGPNGELKVEAPANWQQVYDVTAAMRKRVLAPVDTMGCESLAEESRSPRDQRLQTLVSLMLSSQTKDTVTAAAMRNLQANMPGGFCLDSLLKIPEDELNTLIAKVGFHNTKAKNIKRTAALLQEKWKGDIPATIEGLISLHGVGPKMAYLCMSAAWGRDEGIGVDVHVHRITNLWGWHKTSTPEQTREMLQAWLPREKWHDINHLLVGLGQTICLPIGRKCGECDLAREKLCPSVVAASLVKRRVKKEVPVGGDVVKLETFEAEKDGVSVKVETDVEDLGLVVDHAVAGATDASVDDTAQQI